MDDALAAGLISEAADGSGQLRLERIKPLRAVFSERKFVLKGGIIRRCCVEKLSNKQNELTTQH